MKLFHVLALIAFVAFGNAGLVKRQADGEEEFFELEPEPFTCISGQDGNYTVEVCQVTDPVCQVEQQINDQGEVDVTIKRCKWREACENEQEDNVSHCVLGAAGKCTTCCDTPNCNEGEIEVPIFVELE